MFETLIISMMNRCLTKETKPRSSHRDSTQPVACIRSFEPSVYRVASHCRLIQATFQAQRQLWYSPTCDRYKDTVIVSFHDVKCKQDYIWRKIDTITESLAKTANRAKQNTVQDGLSSKSSHSPGWIQLVMRAHSRQSTPGLRGSVRNSQIPPDSGVQSTKKEKACERWKRRIGEIVSQRSTNCTPLTHTPLFHTTCRLY